MTAEQHLRFNVWDLFLGLMVVMVVTKSLLAAPHVGWTFALLKTVGFAAIWAYVLFQSVKSVADARRGKMPRFIGYWTGIICGLCAALFWGDWIYNLLK